MWYSQTHPVSEKSLSSSCPQPVLVCGDVPAQVEQLAFPFTELHEGCVGLDLPPAEAA